MRKKKKFFKDRFCNVFLNFGFLIKFSISLNISFTVRFFSIIPFVIVSGRPPLLLIITAQPLDAASKLVLPKGSSHLELTTAILVFL